MGLDFNGSSPLGSKCRIVRSNLDHDHDHERCGNQLMKILTLRPLRVVARYAYFEPHPAQGVSGRTQGTTRLHRTI